MRQAVRRALPNWAVPARFRLSGMRFACKCGDVLFETSQGSLDASIETQLQGDRARIRRPVGELTVDAMERIDLQPYMDEASKAI